MRQPNEIITGNRDQHAAHQLQPQLVLLSFSPFFLEKVSNSRIYIALGVLMMIIIMVSRITAIITFIVPLCFYRFLDTIYTYILYYCCWSEADYYLLLVWVIATLEGSLSRKTKGKTG